jgi:hypothetical protein
VLSVPSTPRVSNDGGESGLGEHQPAHAGSGTDRHDDFDPKRASPACYDSDFGDAEVSSLAQISLMITYSGPGQHFDIGRGLSRLLGHADGGAHFLNRQ